MASAEIKPKDSNLIVRVSCSGRAFAFVYMTAQLEAHLEQLLNSRTMFDIKDENWLAICSGHCRTPVAIRS